MSEGVRYIGEGGDTERAVLTLVDGHRQRPAARPTVRRAKVCSGRLMGLSMTSVDFRAQMPKCVASHGGVTFTGR